MKRYHLQAGAPDCMGNVNTWHVCRYVHNTREVVQTFTDNLYMMIHPSAKELAQAAADRLNAN